MHDLLRRPVGTRGLRFAFAAVLIIAATWAGFALFRASRALRQAAGDAASQSGIAFRANRVQLAATVFEPVAAPAVFHDAVVFQGSLFLSGPAGLVEYDSEGAVRARFPTGSVLPAAPVSVAAGAASGAGEPELLIATTGEGLLMYNGRAFRQMRPQDAAFRDLTAVLPLSTGRILLGTAHKGIAVYDGERLAPFHPALANLEVTAIAGDDASLWIGTLNDGVLHWHAGAIQRFGETEGLPDRRVLSIALAGERAFIGTPMGVAEFTDGRFTRALAEGVFARSLLVREGRLHIGTLEEGVMQVPLAAARPRPVARSANPVPGPIERLLEMDGGVYALSEAGLYRIGSNGAWERALDRGATVLADRNISALAFDPAGRLWVGYFDRGLDILEPTLDRATHVENEHVFCVNRIVCDRERGVTAAGTANGLVLFDRSGRQRQVLGRDQGLIANQVTDIALGTGGMTVATPAGITFLDGTGLRSLYAFHGLVNNHAYALAASGERLLVGTLGGLSVLDNDVVRASYTTANSGLRHNWITAIVRAGDEWFVGTYGGGVVRFDASGHWHTFTDLRAPFEVNANAMLATERAVYAGSLREGLYIFDRAGGRWRNVRDGLPSANVTALAAHNGYIYAGTDNGLVRFPEDSR